MSVAFLSSELTTPVFDGFCGRETEKVCDGLAEEGVALVDVGASPGALKVIWMTLSSTASPSVSILNWYSTSGEKTGLSPGATKGLTVIASTTLLGLLGLTNA